MTHSVTRRAAAATALAAALVFLIVSAGCTKDQKEPTAAAAASEKSANPAYFAQQKRSMTATVEAIDPATRRVTLRGPEGNALSFQAGEDVRNLDQVKVGDRVAVEYYESLAVNVQPPGEPVNDVRIATDRAEAGAKPGGMAAQHVTITAVVEKLDKKNATVTLRGPEGNVRTIRVRDPRKLDKVKVGDRVVVTYTEMLAVSVTPAPAAP